MGLSLMVRFLVWFYQFFFWHCLVIVCPPDARFDMSTCGQTYGEHLEPWEEHLMVGARGDEKWTPVPYEDPGLDGWPLVRRSRCEIPERVKK